MLSEALVAAKFEFIVILMVVLLDFVLIGFVLEALFDFFEKGFESLVADLLVVDTMNSRPCLVVL